jgi:hypothetical protein
MQWPILLTSAGLPHERRSSSRAPAGAVVEVTSLPTVHSSRLATVSPWEARARSLGLGKPGQWLSVTASSVAATTSTDTSHPGMGVRPVCTPVVYVTAVPAQLTAELVHVSVE